jgi:4-hydroxybenzoate polyprenyltransferase
MQTSRQVIVFLTSGTLVLASLSQQKLTLLIFILIYTTVGWLYNARPFQLSHRPILSIVFLGIYYALLPCLFGLLLSGNSLTPLFIIFLICYSLCRCSISLLKDYKDVTGDKKHHKHTFLLTYGQRRVALISTVIGLTAYPTIYALILFKSPHTTIAFIALGGLAIIGFMNCINRLQLTKTQDNKKLNRIFQKAFTGENYFSGFLLLCLALH